MSDEMKEAFERIKLKYPVEFLQTDVFKTLSPYSQQATRDVHALLAHEQKQAKRIDELMAMNGILTSRAERGERENAELKAKAAAAIAETEHVEALRDEEREKMIKATVDYAALRARIEGAEKIWVHWSTWTSPVTGIRKRHRICRAHADRNYLPKGEDVDLEQVHAVPVEPEEQNREEADNERGYWNIDFAALLGLGMFIGAAIAAAVIGLLAIVWWLWSTYGPTVTVGW